MTRRALLSRLALLGVVSGGVWLWREYGWQATTEVTFADETRSSGWLPLPQERGLIVAPARLGGVDTLALIDSGAQASVIDRQFAQENGLERAFSLPTVAFGVSGHPQIGRSVVSDLTLGGLTAPRFRGVELDLSGLPPIGGQRIAAIIGRDLLRAVVLDLDQPKRRVALYEPGSQPAPPGATLVPARLFRQALHVDVTVEGKVLDVMLDTGASAGVALSEPAARQVGLLSSGREVRWTRSITFGGMSRDRQVTADAVVFGSETFADIDVQIFSSPRQDLLPDGLLGVGLLADKRALIDLSQARLLIAPSEPMPSPRRPGRRRTQVLDLTGWATAAPR